VIELLGVGAVKRVRFETHFCCDNRLEIEAEPTQIFQVFLNLGLNARDAVNPDGVVAFRSELAEDGKVRLSVADDGPGIPESIRDRIFEPFFTTKDAAQGTGIGLAVVQRIVREHGGEIELDSTPGAGSRFSVVLPLGSCRPAEAPVQAGAATP
jgi:signal transduction histidine kinase